MIRIQTGRRLHFGLFSPLPIPELNLAYGGLGIMVDAPGVVLIARPQSDWKVTGLQKNRVEAILARLNQTHPALSPMHIKVESMAPAHQGWGTGTQLAMAIARLCYWASHLEWSAANAAKVLGRGRRSGIGIVGFDEGGLLLDSGKSVAASTLTDAAQVSAKLFPEDWAFVLIEPGKEQGLHSEDERKAFSQIKQVDHKMVDQLRELAHEMLVHAAGHREFRIFAEQLTAYNRLAGSFYREVQHGDYSSPETEQRLAFMEKHGAIGRGQSSWGPGLFALFQSRREAESFSERCRLPGCSMIVAQALNTGATVSQWPDLAVGIE